MRKLLMVALVIAAAALLWPRSRASAGSPCSVPKSWGELKGAIFASYGAVSLERVVFEAADGTIRIVAAECGNPPKATVITRSEN